MQVHHLLPAFNVIRVCLIDLSRCTTTFIWWSKIIMIVFAGNFPRRKILRRAAGATPCHKRFNYKSALFSCWQIHKDFTAEQNCFPRHIGQTLGPPICHFDKNNCCPQFFRRQMRRLDANMEEKNWADQMHQGQNDAKFDRSISSVPYLYLSNRCRHWYPLSITNGDLELLMQKPTIQNELASSDPSSFAITQKYSYSEFSVSLLVFKTKYWTMFRLEHSGAVSL